MSLVFDSCDEQYIGYEQLLILLTQVDNDGNPYINIANSGLNTGDLQDIHCNQEMSLLALIKKAIVYDNDGNLAVNIANLDNATTCNLRLDFEHFCNSQYLTII